MITLIIVPNFKGTWKEIILCIVICILLDSIYMAPMLIELS